MRVTRTILLGLMLCGLNGCLAAGAVAYKVMGPPYVQPEYILEKRPTLVLVENYTQLSTSAWDSQQLNRYLVDELRSHELAPVIDEMQLYQLRTQRGDAYRRMTIPEIGQAVGAEQVLYVDLLSVTVRSPQTGGMLKGEIAVRVRVVDVATGSTLWPSGASEGQPMGYETPMQSLNEPRDVHGVRQQLYRQMAGAIGRLFYKYKPDEIDTKN